MHTAYHTTSYAHRTHSIAGHHQARWPYYLGLRPLLHRAPPRHDGERHQASHMQANAHVVCFFLCAQAVELGEAACVEPRGVRTTSGKLLEAGVVIKAVGFETNAANSQLLGRTHMRSNGLVDRDLWLLVEPHLDKEASNSPFASSYLNAVTFSARSMLRYWQNPDRMGAVLAAPLPLVPIDTFTLSDTLSGAAVLATADPATAVELDEHQKVTPRSFLHAQCVCVWLPL